MRNSLVSIFVIISLLAWTSPAQGISWTVTCLDPTFSTLSNVSGATASQQVGSANMAWGDRAAIWTGTPGSFVNLNPGGALSSRAYATTGTQQVGSVDFGSGSNAVTWAGSGPSFVNLNPSGAKTSVAYATSGTQQVGMACFSYEIPNAVRWTGTSGSCVNLNPSGASRSVAYATTGSQQAGSAEIGGQSHAGIWSGTAGSFVDLNPSGASNSYAYATTGTQQAGVADGHAAVWSGTPLSFADLNPTGSAGSAIYATTGTWQAGYADVGPDAVGVGHAGIWKGTAGSFIDLDVLLPSQYRGGGSWANAIHVSGRDIWVGGGTFGGHAIIWHGVVPDLTIKAFFDCNNNGVYEQAGDDKMLSGWEFEVKDSIGTVIGTYTTDQNGEIVLANLTTENYTITATVKKDHYVTGGGGNPRVVGVTVGGDTVVWFGVRLDGDINQDGVVDGQDFTILKAHFGESGTTWTEGNLNLDGLTDAQDFTILKANYGSGASSTQESSSATGRAVPAGTKRAKPKKVK